jgi:FAD/FMN-containing dehydrogenase
MMIEQFARCPSPMAQMLLEHFHGAATRVKPTDTAFPHRADGYNLLVLGEWADPNQTASCVAWTRETYAAMGSFMGTGRYVNYLSEDESGDPVAAAYGPNYQRLREIKSKYDPGNFFHVNQNVPPLA